MGAEKGSSVGTLLSIVLFLVETKVDRGVIMWFLLVKYGGMDNHVWTA